MKIRVKFLTRITLILLIFLNSQFFNSANAGDQENPYRPPNNLTRNADFFKNKCGLFFENDLSVTIPSMGAEIISVNSHVNLKISVLNQEQWKQLANEAENIDPDDVLYIEYQERVPRIITIAGYIYGLGASAFGSHYVLSSLQSLDIQRIQTIQTMGGLVILSVYGAIFVPRGYRTITNFYKRRREVEAILSRIQEIKSTTTNEQSPTKKQMHLYLNLSDEKVWTRFQNLIQ